MFCNSIKNFKRLIAGQAVSMAVLMALPMATSVEATAQSAVPESATISFGIVPQQSATELAKRWMPLIEHLSAKTGLSIQFATAKDIPSFEACMAKSAYGMAYMNPYHYTVFHENGYRAAAHQAGKKLKGIVVVRKDSPVKSIKDLGGKTLAFPSPAAFGASVLPRAEMTNQGIQFKPQYVRSHDSVYRAVLAGILPAGGGVLRTFGNQSDEARANLRVVYETDAYTPHAFAVHKTLGSDVHMKIKQALTQLPANLLKPLGMKGIAGAESAAWDDVRALGLERAQTEIKEGGTVQCHSD